MASWGLALVALVAGGALAGEECVAGGGGEGSCAAGGEPATTRQHYWPRSRGIVGSYGSTTLHGPLNLTSSLAWKWIHPNKTVHPGSVLLDSSKNIYSSALDGMRKFSPDGSLLWYYHVNGDHACNPSIMEDTLYGSTLSGLVYALDIETGTERWSHTYAKDAQMDTPYVEAFDGMVFAIFDSRKTETSFIPGNTRIVGMKAENGEKMWEYTSDKVLWNFMPMFVGDGTFLTMDIHGGLHRLQMSSGAVVWYRPPPEEQASSFTDGGVILGPGNDVAYTCSNTANAVAGYGTLGDGVLRAYRVADGALLWTAGLAQPCVSWPAVSADNRTVVVPIGALPFPVAPSALLTILVVALWTASLLLNACVCLVGCSGCLGKLRKVRRCSCTVCALLLLALLSMPLLHWFSIHLGQQQHKLWQTSVKPLAVWAFDAQTGATRWHFDDIPTWNKTTCRGDEDLLLPRLLAGNLKRFACGPASWGAPTIDGRGTVYVGAMNGLLYAIRDADGNGVIDTATEVSILDIESASLHPGASFAPGMMAYGSCNGIFVFNT